MAWLRGRFLARGSLSLAGGRTHLEFVVPVEEAPELPAPGGARPAGVVARAAPDGVVTWKSTESIVPFLRRIGANASLLELEARQVARSLRGDLNRVLNAESANLQRSVAAAGRQLAAIELLAADGRLAEQSLTVRASPPPGERRRRRRCPRSPSAGPHRSAVQRALDRLERLALSDEGVGRRERLAAERWDRRLDAHRAILARRPASRATGRPALVRGCRPGHRRRAGRRPRVGRPAGGGARLWHDQAMRPIVIAANWKMNTTPADAGELARTIASRTRVPGVTRVICPPFVCLAAVA